MADSLSIIDKVNAFYSGAFSQLMTLTIAILGFAGVVIPLLIQFLQSRSFRIERDSLRDFVRQEVSLARAQLLTDLEADFGERSKNIQQQILLEIDSKFHKLRKELQVAKAGLFHLQGNSRMAESIYVLAIQDYCIAAEGFITAEDERNAQTVLRLIGTNCLPEINKDDFELPIQFGKKLEDLLTFLKAHNENGRYGIFIDEITTGLALARKREKPSEKATGTK